MKNLEEHKLKEVQLFAYSKSNHNKRQKKNTVENPQHTPPPKITIRMP